MESERLKSKIERFNYFYLIRLATRSQFLTKMMKVTFAQQNSLFNKVSEAIAKI